MIHKILDVIVAALAWWIDGLWLGLPPSVRSGLFRERDQVTVWLDGARVTIDVTAGSGKSRTLTIDAAESDAAAREPLRLAAGADATIVLPPTVGLSKTLRLPSSAEPALREVLSHELDRLTPFAIDEIAFDHWIRAHDGDKLVVEIALARKQALDSVFATAARLGLEPTRVTVAGHDRRPLPLNLSPRARRLRLPFTQAPVSPRVAALAAIAAIAALYLPLYRYQDALASYERETAALREQAVAARAELTRREAALVRTDFMTARRASYVAPLDLLLELTRDLPEHTWLSRFSMTPTEVLLQGESGAAPDLLKIVEATPHLQAAQFQTPLSRDDLSGKDQFTIVAALSKASP